MSFRLFKNISQKYSILTVVGICLIAVVFNTSAFLFTDVIDDDDHFVQLQISIEFTHYKDFQLTDKIQHVTLSITPDNIRDRSPPLS